MAHQTQTVENLIKSVKFDDIDVTSIDIPEWHIRSDRRVRIEHLRYLVESISALGYSDSIVVIPGAEGRYSVVDGASVLLAAIASGAATVPCTIVKLQDEPAAQLLLQMFFHLAGQPWEIEDIARRAPERAGAVAGSGALQAVHDYAEKELTESYLARRDTDDYANLPERQYASLALWREESTARDEADLAAFRQACAQTEALLTGKDEDVSEAEAAWRVLFGDLQPKEAPYSATDIRTILVHRQLLKHVGPPVEDRFGVGSVLVQLYEHGVKHDNLGPYVSARFGLFLERHPQVTGEFVETPLAKQQIRISQYLRGKPQRTRLQWPQDVQDIIDAGLNPVLEEFDGEPRDKDAALLEMLSSGVLRPYVSLPAKYRLAAEARATGDAGSAVEGNAGGSIGFAECASAAPDDHSDEALEAGSAVLPAGPSDSPDASGDVAADVAAKQLRGLAQGMQAKSALTSAAATASADDGEQLPPGASVGSVSPPAVVVEQSAEPGAAPLSAGATQFSEGVVAERPSAPGNTSHSGGTSGVASGAQEAQGGATGSAAHLLETPPTHSGQLASTRPIDPGHETLMDRAAGLRQSHPSNAVVEIVEREGYSSELVASLWQSWFALRDSREQLKNITFANEEIFGEAGVAHVRHNPFLGNRLLTAERFADLKPRNRDGFEQEYLAGTITYEAALADPANMLRGGVFAGLDELPDSSAPERKEQVWDKPADTSQYEGPWEELQFAERRVSPDGRLATDGAEDDGADVVAEQAMDTHVAAAAVAANEGSDPLDPATAVYEDTNVIVTRDWLALREQMKADGTYDDDWGVTIAYERAQADRALLASA